MLRLAAAAALLLIAAEAHAQAEVVVTASRVAEDARQTGRDVTVITAAEIARSPARSLDELLRAEAGVAVVSRGGAGTQADITLRGSTFNGVLFLIDGARFNDPMTGHFLSDFPIPLAEIARVEILRGPAAAVWGPDALGGVVHVLTRTGLWAERAETGGQATFALGQNPDGQLDLAARHFGTTRAVSAAVDLFATNGEAIRDADGDRVVGTNGEVRTDALRLAGTVAGALSVGAQILTVRVAGDARTFGAYQFYTPFPSDTAREATATLWAQARLQPRRTGRTAWSVGVAARQHADLYTFNPAATPSDHTSRRAGLTAEASRQVTPRVTLGVGASAEARAIASNTLGDHSDLAAGVFGLARVRPAAALTLTASGRVDADETFGVQLTPSLSAAFQALPGLTLRASAGRAVRAPDYVERFLNTLAPRPNGNLGNPDLRAERALNAEAGFDLDAAPGITLRATGFWRRTDDLIDYARLAPTDDFFLAQNVLQSTAAGAEASLDAARRLGEARLTGGVSATYTHIALDGTQPGAVYKYALGHAPLLIQSRVGLDVRGVRLTTEALWKDRYSLPSYLWIDARLAADVPRTDGAVEAFASVRNLTDTDAAETFGAPLPGRTVLGGVRARFGR